MEFGIEPQLARAAAALPVGPEWGYEQKFDGFRAIVFVDGDEHRLQSRGAKDLTRYFPELRFPPGRYVLDGEIVIDGEREGAEAFGALQQRIHPAASRIERLAREWPASYVAFDLLERDGARAARRAVRAPPRRARGARRACAARSWCATRPRPSAGSSAAEGVVAKRLDAPYAAGKRTAMMKVKRVRTIDCVVLGYRPGTAAGTIGSLILGLYEPDGRLRPVGHSSAFSAKREARAAGELARLRDRRARQRRAEPLDRRPRARVGRAAPGAGRRGHLRPRRATAASATARRSCAGATTSRRGTARSTS